MTGEHFSSKGLQDLSPEPSDVSDFLAARRARARNRHSLPWPPPTGLEVVRRVLTSSAVWGFLLALATWPYSVSRFEQAFTGLDASWVAALSMATHFGIPFGTRAVFTYGPLGFLTSPNVLFYPDLAFFSILFQVAMAATFYGLLIQALRRLTWTPAAVVVAAIAGAPAVVNWTGSEPLIGVGLFLTLELLRRDPDDPAGDFWWAGLGLLVGVNSLAKASGALDVGVVALLALLLARRRRRYWSTALAVSVCIVVFAVGWFGTGNGFGNLAAFARADASITSGYSAAMYSLGFGIPTYEFWLVGLTAIGVGFLAWTTHPPVDLPGPDWRSWRAWLPLARCIATGLAIAVTLWILFKAGIVKQGLRLYFINLPLVLAALLTRPLRRLRRVPDRSTLVVGVLAAAMCGYVTTLGVPSQLVAPVADGVNLAREVHGLFSAPEVDRLENQNRATLRTDYAVPAAMVSAVSGSTVDIEPLEQELAYAYPQMRWDPLPVFQEYAAYTTYLDQLNARFLGSGDAPRFILRQTPRSIDDRIPQFDPPATQIEIECRYHQVQASPSWELLERGPDRCGRPTPLGTVSTGFGHSISVPAARHGGMVVAEFSIHLSLGWHLLDIFDRPPGVNVRLNGAAAGNRILVGTAPDLHLLLAPAALGYGPSFAPMKIRTFTFSLQGHAPTANGIVVRFYSISFR